MGIFRHDGIPMTIFIGVCPVNGYGMTDADPI